jgi:hypothetical protein
MEIRNILWKSVIVVSLVTTIGLACKKGHAFGIGLNPPELTEIRDIAHEISAERHEREREEREFFEAFREECSNREKQRVWDEVCDRFREEGKEIAKSFDSHSYEPGWNGRACD